MLYQTTESVARPQQQHRTRWLVQLHFVAFIAILIAWTIALLVPVPKKTAAVVLGGEDPMFWFGKCLHIGAYTFLTVLGIALPLTQKQRLWLLAGFVFHGAATEFLQQFVERGASVRDVILDSIGVVIGWGVWSWALPRRAS